MTDWDAPLVSQDTRTSPADRSPDGGTELFKIRLGAQADAAALAEFAARTFSDTFANDNSPEDLALHVASSYGVDIQERELTSEGLVTLLAETAGRLAAYAQVRRAATPHCITGEAPIELWRFYVDQPWQGRGLARLLMEAVRDVAGDLGGRTLWLGVWERNRRALAFYTKCGFRDVGSHEFWVGSDRQVDRIMVAELR